jgi:hypothetical protein
LERFGLFDLGHHRDVEAMLEDDPFQLFHVLALFLTKERAMKSTSIARQNSGQAGPCQSRRG